MRHFKLLERSLVITPNCRKPLFLQYKREYPENDIVLMTVEELEALFLFKHDDRALRALLEMGKGYKEAKDILKVLSYMNLEKEYASSKLQGLQRIAKELFDKGFLYKDEYANRAFKGRDIVIDGYNDGKRISYALDNVPNISLNWLPPSDKSNNKPRIAEFSNMYEELHYLCNRIACDIDKGKKPTDICISGYDEEYRLTLSLMSRAYGFSVAFPTQKTLRDTKMGKAFLDGVAALDSLDEARMSEYLESLREKYGSQEGFEKIVRLAFGLLCNGISKERQLQIYLEALKEKKAPEGRVDNAVQILDEDFPIDGAYIYRINFNISNSPRVASNNDYLFDEEKEELGMRTSRVVNEEAKKDLIAFLSSPCIQSVSYHARHLNQSKNPSSLMADKESKVSESVPYLVEVKPKLDCEYSKEFSKLWGAALLDGSDQYGIRAAELDFLNFALNLRKTTYSNNFEHFEGAKNQDGKIVLSASSLDTFYKCPFHYYCAYLLKIDDSESTFSALVGTIFHKVLEDFYDADFNPKESYDNAIADQERKRGFPFTTREKVLLDNLYDFIIRDIDFLKEHDDFMRSPDDNGRYPPSYLREFRKTILVDGNVFLTGSADKIILTERPGASFATFVDYKTYGKKFNAKAMEYGLSLQLPLYAYLFSNIPEFAGKEIAGLFIAPILPNLIHGKDDKSLEETRRNELKLEGIFSDNLDALYSLDYNWKASTIISSCRYGKSGFASSNNRVTSEERMEEIVDQAKEKILEAANRIRAGEFEIMATDIKNGEEACKYCPFRDVCYRRADQIRTVILKEDEIGGENNA